MDRTASLIFAGLLALPATAAAQTVLVDDEDGAPTFTTTGNDWTTWATNGEGWSGSDSSYHYLSHTVGGSDRRGTATWSPDLPAAGSWRVETWFRRTENRTHDADHFVYDAAGGVTHIVLDQRGAGGSGWIDLGTYPCDAGPGGCWVVLDGTDDDHSDEADAMRFVLVAEEPPGDDDDDEPPVEDPDPCAEFPGLGRHVQEAAAEVVTAEGWDGALAAAGPPDGDEATTPNADAGEYLEGAGFAVCDPPGEETIESVEVSLLGRTQYEDGPYVVRMQLSAGGQASVPWNGTATAWHGLDATSDRAAWSWADVAEVTARTELLDHPGGNRDSDVWVDALRLTVTYTTTEAPEQPGDDDDSADDEEPEPTDDDDAEPEEPTPEDPGPADIDEGVAPAAQDDACGCAQTLDGGVGLALLVAPVLGLRRRPSRSRAHSGRVPPEAASQLHP